MTLSNPSPGTISPDKKRVRPSQETLTYFKQQLTQLVSGISDFRALEQTLGDKSDSKAQLHQVQEDLKQKNAEIAEVRIERDLLISQFSENLELIQSTHSKALERAKQQGSDLFEKLVASETNRQHLIDANTRFTRVTTTLANPFTTTLDPLDKDLNLKSVDNRFLEDTIKTLGTHQSDLYHQVSRLTHEGTIF